MMLAKRSSMFLMPWPVVKESPRNVMRRLPGGYLESVFAVVPATPFVHLPIAVGPAAADPGEVQGVSRVIDEAEIGFPGGKAQGQEQEEHQGITQNQCAPGKPGPAAASPGGQRAPGPLRKGRAPAKRARMPGSHSCVEVPNTLAPAGSNEYAKALNYAAYGSCSCLGGGKKKLVLRRTGTTTRPLPMRIATMCEGPLLNATATPRTEKTTVST